MESSNPVEAKSALKPPPPYLSGRYKDSFAYPTLKDRVPTIICKVIDLLHRQRRVLEQDQNTLKNCIEKMVSFNPLLHLIMFFCYNNRLNLTFYNFITKSGSHLTSKSKFITLFLTIKQKNLVMVDLSENLFLGSTKSSEMTGPV